jgi:Na+-driven multidrug efflux pump
MHIATQNHLLHFIPKRYGQVVFSAIMSVTISCFMSGVLTAINTGLDAGFVSRWLHAWVVALPLAFLAVTITAPRVRRLIDLLTK